MKMIITMLMLTTALLFSAERMRTDPDRNLRVIMTDTEGMPLEDGFYNVSFRIYDKSIDGVLIDEKAEYVESKNGVCRISDLTVSELLSKGYKEVWVALKIEDLPETKFRTRIFLDLHK